MDSIGDTPSTGTWSRRGARAIWSLDDVPPALSSVPRTSASLRHHDKKRTYSYSIVAGPLPVAAYKATLHVEENKDGKSCKVEWSSTFEPSGVSEPEAVKVIRGIYEAGFENLRKMFGQ